MSADPFCKICRAAVESSNHIFCDCIKACLVWNALLKPDLFRDFLSIDIRSSIETNLRHPNYYPIDTENWETLFRLVIWNLWIRRNKLIFDSNLTPVESVYQQIKKMLFETMNALRVQESWTAPSLARVNPTIQWEPPPLDWFKINMDGACRWNSGLATCGGVIRNHLGEWVLGLSKTIGCCFALDAELWGIYKAMIPHVTALIKRSWMIMFRYIPRQGNGVADYLDKLAWSLPSAVRTFHQPPAKTLSAFHKDNVM
ncbi:hypothetical protein F3Y22_tig00111095pilonHSYRG00679 [Hibiscus syriacus]|uniref:RNase H type-1 domain-containing protein n=1 Tax=Hibiscus syriacus TaxID=106335 RepID=A0A6A2Z1N1_HIBSY|nr:hypothetical protein F3Y22_tig00111095pilonHSYRG00679 [Hibiscus syriacus]